MELALDKASTEAWLRLQRSTNYTVILVPRDTVTDLKPE